MISAFCMIETKMYIGQQWVKGSVMQIEKALMNDCQRVQKYPESFAFYL